jgi:hypothetical protein
MYKNFSFNRRHSLYILGYHSIIILFLLFLFFKADVNFDLIFTYKVLCNPFAYKSIFYYLYGYYGFLGILTAHIISSVYIIISLFYNAVISRKILLFHGLIPLYGSIYGYLFSKKLFVNFGFFGEVLGYIFNFYTKSWNFIIFYVISFLLIMLILQLKNILILINCIYVVLEKIKLIAFFKHFYRYFISWAFFFIPLLKKYYRLKNYISIESLIHESIYVDFYKISQSYSIDVSCNNQNQNNLKNREILAHTCITIKKNNIQNYQLEITEIEKNLLLDAFNYFNIRLTYVTSTIGPLVNTIIVTPEKEVKISRINQLLPDIARIIGKSDIRFIYPIAAHPHSVAFEYSHNNTNILDFFTYAHDDYFLQSSPLTLLLGVNTVGVPYYIDIAKAPHILLAGTTGSGKSNILNLCITELVWKNTATEVQLILLDPKKSEFFLFESLPHLLFRVAQSIQEIDDAIISALNIMEERYVLFNTYKCKNIYEYNQKYDKLSFIVIIIDEYADIVIQSKPIELKIIRLLQMSRAAGMHIIVATQRPSADIISSIVKSNLPMRIACKVVNSINSRIILDIEGAEKLLGNSDMLLFFNNKYERVHGLFIDSGSIQEIIDCFNNN